jgi:hypothetical protein
VLCIVLSIGGVVFGLGALAWAAFFSVGFKGGSTDEMIRYNLGHPLEGSIAYGPLGCSGLVFSIGLVLLIVAVTRRSRPIR